MNNQKQIMQKFVQERNEALLSLDENKIKAYLQKYQVGLPSNPISFWGAVYKAILAITDAPEDKKAIARTWLKEHGMRETF